MFHLNFLVCEFKRRRWHENDQDEKKSSIQAFETKAKSMYEISHLKLIQVSFSGFLGVNLFKFCDIYNRKRQSTREEEKEKDNKKKNIEYR